MADEPMTSAATRPGDEGHRKGDPIEHFGYGNNAASIPDGDPDNEFREWPVCIVCNGEADDIEPPARHL